jgi:hypothetical protein
MKNNLKRMNHMEKEIIIILREKLLNAKTDDDIRSVFFTMMQFKLTKEEISQVLDGIEFKETRKEGKPDKRRNK